MAKTCFARPTSALSNADASAPDGLSVRFTEEAETDLLEILDYLAEESESAAVRVRDAIYDAVERIAERPGIGHTREDLTDRALKFWSVYSYLVVYDRESRPLTIVAVLHGARNVGEMLKGK